MNIKNRQKLLVLVAGTVVALFLADRLLVEPLIAGWKQRQTRIADLRKKVAEGRTLVERERTLRNRWDYMRSNTLPDNASQAEQQVLKAIDSWSQQTRLTILSLSPQWKHDGDEYMTLECRVEASGNLDAVSRFLYELEKDPLALRLQNLEISARDNEGQQLALGLQLSGLVLTPTQTGGRK